MQQKGEHTTKEADRENAPERKADPMERFKDAFELLIPGVDTNTVLRDSVRIEVEMGVASVRWEGFKRVTPEQAMVLFESLRRTT